MKRYSLAIAFIVLIFSSCGPNVAVTAMNPAKEGASAVKPPLVCQPGQVKVTRPSRVLFIVDQSGSNLNGPFENPAKGTDPQKTFRTTVMNDFVSTNKDKAHVSWGLTVFNGSSAQSLVSADSKEVPFSNVADFGSALDLFKARKDSGDTPYKAALKKALQYVATDLISAPKNTAYLIAFITDGFPTDYCPGFSNNCPGQVEEHLIDADVRKISKLNKNVKFSTVYYGEPNGEATARLQRMADAGNGQFVDSNVSSKIDLNDIIEIEQEVCQ
ncbi:MAG: vWA domain-containing protein [Bdellovibrionota bacterium]